MKNCKAHKSCMKDKMQEIEELFAKNSLILTPLRQKILEIIFRDHGAIKAYDILDELRKEGFSDKPPTVYRVLDFLLQNQIVHKLSSINSYIICSHLTKHKDCYFLICNKCETVVECCNKYLSKIIDKTANDNKFNVEKTIVEISGICKSCQKN